jgi:hypothetical protein
MGLDYAAIIMAGSLVSFFVLVPLFAYLGAHIPGPIEAGAAPLSTLPPDEIFYEYVRPIGIGGIFAARSPRAWRSWPTSASPCSPPSRTPRAWPCSRRC